MNSTELEYTVGDLQAQVKALEDRLPRSSIIDNSSWKRAWTVFGYSLATGFLICARVLVLALILAFGSQ